VKLLVLGGTKFLGRQIVQTALERGHEVTVFNRGRTNSALFPGVQKLVGDRDTGDVTALAGGEWDLAIDFSAFLPRQIVDVASQLDGRIGHYAFMSSIAVYARTDLAGMTEDAPLLAWEPGSPEVWSMDNYGSLKVGCERAVAAAFPGRSGSVRSGFIIGPYGPDMGSWGVNLAAGQDISCSLKPEQPIQVLDSRDLAEFMLASGVDGPVNVVSATVTVAELAEAWCSCVPGARVHWGSDGDDLGLSPEENVDGTFRLSNARAVGAGLRLRTAEQTAQDYLEWIRSGGTPPPAPH
jgi:2'-hydroxyisoflavone reductase